MEKGYLSLVLHGHLPFIRHPEHENFLEENWFYEGITETYIPLILVFEKLINDGVDFRIAMTLSPTLLSMFCDSLLQERYLNQDQWLKDRSLTLDRLEADWQKAAQSSVKIGLGLVEVAKELKKELKSNEEFQALLDELVKKSID